MEIKAGALAVAGLLWLGSTAGAFADLDEDPGEPFPRDDGWNVTTLEASTILGESLFQVQDMSRAKARFRDSLGASTRVLHPEKRWMALDFYRSAEIALREGDVSAARRNLEMLVFRYPDTRWAEKGRLLLFRLPGTPEDDLEEEPSVTAPDEQHPTFLLGRLQAALRAGRMAEAVGQSKLFLERHPRGDAAEEARLALGIAHLELGQASEAVRALEPAASGAKQASARSKARYLLGAAYLSLGDDEALGVAVGETEARGGDKWSALAQTWRAVSDQRRGRHDRAAARYRAVLASGWDSPVKAYALAGLAVESARGGSAGAAASRMRGAAEAALRDGLPELGAYARLCEGHLHYRRRRYDEAQRAYADFLRRSPGHPQAPGAAYQRAMALKWSGHKERAIAAFQEVARDYADANIVSSAHLQLGQLYVNKGAASKAIESYERMRSSGEGMDKEATLLIAQVHYNQKRYREAAPHYLKFLETAGDDPRARQVEELLLSSYWLGDRDATELEQAAERYPSHPIVAQIRWELGGRAFKAKRYEQAAEHFRRVAEDFPRTSYVPESLFFRAECLTQIGEHAAAAAAYRSVMARFPGSPHARQSAFKEGLALYQAGRYEEAARSYQRNGGLLKGELAADAIYNTALAHGKAGRKDAALSSYEELVRRYPRYPKAPWIWFEIGTIRESSGRWELATRAYARVTGPERPQALYNIGRCRERLDQRAQAQKAYERLEAVEPENDPHRLRGLLRLALLYELKDPGRSLPLYRDVVRMSRDKSLSEIAVKRMQTLFREKRLLES